MRDLRASTRFQLLPMPEIGWFRSLSLILGDLIGLGLAWYLASRLNASFQPLPEEFVLWEVAGLPSLFYFMALAILLVLGYQGFYDSTSQSQNYLKQVQSISTVFLSSLVVSYFYDPKLDVPRSLFFTAWLGSIGCVFLMRLFLILGLHQLAIAQNQILVFIIAPSERVTELTRTIQRCHGYEVVGWINADRAYSAEAIAKIINSKANEVIAESLPETHLASDLYWQLRTAHINLRLAPSSLAMLHRRGMPEIFAGMPTIKISSQFLGIWEYRCKRVIDFLGALAGIILLAPVFTVIAIAIKVSSPGSVFFAQERVGLNGNVFQMWKFRSMCADAGDRQAELERFNESKDGVMFKLKHDPRIIPIGHFLRRLSLDELPQLFNVLMGQMSLVGPRPLPLRDVAKFEEWHHIRHLVLPGITGLWQISGRSDLDTIDDTARLDLHYIDHWSLNLDLAILVETISTVLFGKGAY
jgi:exopolysaccharide biosynthesis polyprenyl glycosylphosphotransferase